MPNTSPETGIRYGTIYLNDLDGDVANDLWMSGKNISEENAYAELKSEIERDADSIEEEVRIAIAESDHALLSSERFVENEIEAAYARLGYDSREDYIDTRLELESENIQIDEPIIEGTCEGVRYMISHLGGASLLWVFESPIIGMFDLCSPCVPNACSLESPNPDGYEGYDVPADWRMKDGEA